MAKINKISVAWAAGFFDGEGHISVKRQKCKTHKRGISHSLIISADQMDIKPLQKLKKLFGGRISFYKTKNNPCNIWSLRQKEMTKFLNETKPFLTTKKKECEIALKFLKLTNNKIRNNLSDSNFNKREIYYFKLRNIKKEKYGRSSK